MSANRTSNVTPVSLFSVAMIEPEFALNLGYVARAMANFGMRRLFVVSKRKIGTRKLEDARMYASHGNKIIDDSEVVNSLSELRNRFDTLIGTTAIQATRKSNITRKTLDLDHFASRFSRQKLNRASSVCIVLGRDTTGMTNAELRRCDYNITIKTGAVYNTLNISHAATIIFYVLSRRLKSELSFDSAYKLHRKERDIAVSLFERLAEEVELQGFKSGLLSQALTNLFNKSEPTLRELYILMGLASKASSKIHRLTSSP